MQSVRVSRLKHLLLDLMGLTDGKSPNLGPEWTEDSARWFKVLADPIRIRILHLPATNESAVCACDIVAKGN